MFVKKIIQNRKRLEYTIKKYEEDEMKKLKEATEPSETKPSAKVNIASDAS